MHETRQDRDVQRKRRRQGAPAPLPEDGCDQQNGQAHIGRKCPVWLRSRKGGFDAGNEQEWKCKPLVQGYGVGITLANLGRRGRGKPKIAEGPKETKEPKEDQQGAANNPLAQGKLDQTQWMQASPIELTNLLRVTEGGKAMLCIPDKIR